MSHTKLDMFMEVQFIPQFALLELVPQVIAIQTRQLYIDSIKDANKDAYTERQLR